MADRRRRKKPSEGDSEEEVDKKETDRDVRQSECESEGEPVEADISEYESANEDHGQEEEEDDEEEEESDEEETDDDDDDDDDETYDGEDEDVLLEGEEYDGFVDEERQSGDGEEQPDKGDNVDDDEDKKNPAYVPRKGAFYEHDMRISMDEQEEDDKKPKKKLWKDDGKWLHDKFRLDQQAPKSQEELITMYGYDIRQRDKPPEAVFRSNRPRGRRSQQKPSLRDFVTDQNDEFVEWKNKYNSYQDSGDRNYNNENRRNYNSARNRFDDDRSYGNKREYSRTPDRERNYGQENDRGYRRTPDRDRGYQNREDQQGYQGREERENERVSYDQRYQEGNHSGYREENRGNYREEGKSNYREDNRGYNREENKRYPREDTRGNYRRNNEDNRRGYDDNRRGYDDNRRGYENNRRGYDDNRRDYEDNRRSYDDNRSYEGNRGYDQGGRRGFRDRGRGGNRGRGRGERGRRPYNDSRENKRPERNYPPRFQRAKEENLSVYEGTDYKSEDAQLEENVYTEPPPSSSQEQKQPFPPPPNVKEEPRQAAPVAETVSKNELNIVVQNAGERKSYSKDRRARTVGKTRAQESSANAVDHGGQMNVGSDHSGHESVGQEATDQQKVAETSEETSNAPASQQFDGKGYSKQDLSQHGKSKRYSSQRQRNLPEMNYPEQVPIEGPAFFNSGQTTFRPPPPPQMLRPPISTVFPIPATSDTLTNQPRVFAPTRPPPPAAAVSLATQVPIIPQYNNTGVIFGAPPPPAPPTYQVPPGVPIQGFPSPPAGHAATVPLAPPPQVAASSQSQEVYRGGTTYYPPELQYKGSKRSPVRRPKAAIPIVNPQDVKIRRAKGEKATASDSMEESDIAYQALQDYPIKDEMALSPDIDVIGYQSDPASPSEITKVKDLEVSELSSQRETNSVHVNDARETESGDQVSKSTDKESGVTSDKTDSASRIEPVTEVKETCTASSAKELPDVKDIKKVEVEDGPRENKLANESQPELPAVSDIKSETDT